MYNYDRFSTKFFDFSLFEGPDLGESIADIPLSTIEGSEVRLSDFKGKRIVLETGSTTCPMFVKNIRPMNELSQRFPDTLFVVLYVREAHPGEKLKGHKNISDKVKCASGLHKDEGENRIILVDSIDGKMHSKLGLLPDMLYIIDENGKVIFRSSWNEAILVERFLKNDLADKELIQAIREPSKPNPLQIFRATRRGGVLSFWDLFLSLPKLILMHKEVQKRLKQEKHKSLE